MSTTTADVLNRAADIIEMDGLRRSWQTDGVGHTVSEAIHIAAHAPGVRGGSEGCRLIMDAVAKSIPAQSLHAWTTTPGVTEQVVVSTLRSLAAELA